MASAPPATDLGPVRVVSKPGIKRDGTDFEGENYVDGRWTRFDRGLPRKMGGYRAINKYLSAVVRTIHGRTKDLQTYVHAASAAAVERFIVEGNGNTSIITDRTPASGLAASVNNMWQFDTVTNGGTSTLVAQVAPNLECVCNSLGGALFTGSLFGTAALTEVTTVPANFDATGGVVVLHPYTVVFGQNGYVAWSVPGDPEDFTSAGAGNAYVTGNKLLRGLPLRNGPGNNPAGLLWSADSLLLMSYVGGTGVFDFSHLSSEISVLGVNTIVEHDGVFYWAGTDHFHMFSGVVREVPNDYNLDWFYSNINMSQRQKCFAFTIPRFGEIWWCFPFGDATECTHAVIYNTRLQVWYDTELPNGGRSAALSPAIFRKPMMAGVDPEPYSATDATIVNDGAGYVAGDILTVVGGTSTVPVQLQVTTVSSGNITGVAIANTGTYTTEPTNPVSVTGGSGSGATFTMTFNEPYRFWIHEDGVDQTVDQSVQPIRAYFKTGEMSLAINAGRNQSLTLRHLEPDFEQTGPMTVCAYGRYNARAPLRCSADYVFEAPTEDTPPAEQTIPFKFQARFMWFYFESNALGGDFWLGHTLAHLSAGDGRVRG